MRKIFLFLLLIIIVAVGFFFLAYGNVFKRLTPNLSSPGVNQTQSEAVKVIAKNLDTPWALAFLPEQNDKLLLTERPGKLSIVDLKNGAVNLISEIKEVKEIGEGGLLGVAVDPQFSTNRFIYLYYTYQGDSQRTLNRVVRYVFDGQTISSPITIVDQIPSASNHNGGRIKFGPASPRGEPDGLLYITTGDAQNPSLAQDKNSLAGKILRINRDEVETYSYGHRNPQGITWDGQGRLWAVEHGQSAHDELNLIEFGKNYGWPIIQGKETKEGMVTPILESGSETWAPAGIAHLNGSVFFGGLRGQSLFEVNLDNMQVKKHFSQELGRIREVIVGPDKMLYFTTSNRDGRGLPAFDDDKIIRLDPSLLPNRI